jgi:hypothetical protein
MARVSVITKIFSSLSVLTAGKSLGILMGIYLYPFPIVPSLLGEGGFALKQNQM